MRILDRFLEKFYYSQNSELYLKYLKKKGIRIGKETQIFDPHNIHIDTTRPELVEIGEHVFLHRGTKILTHDWASWCFVYSHNEFIPSHGKIILGNNIWLGENVTILKNVTIGDNVIIGIGSIVTKTIPNNCVAVGAPAKVICSYDEYLEKRRKEYEDEAKEYARAIIKSGRRPTVEDFRDDYPAFIDSTNYDKYDFPYSSIFSPNQFKEWLKKHKSSFHGFEDFINKV